MSNKPDNRDRLILNLAERLYICSRLLTAAAMRLSWDDAEVCELVAQLRTQLAKSAEDKATLF